MPMTPEAAKIYKPRRKPGAVEDVVKSEEKQKLLKEAEDMKMQQEAGKAYEASRTTYAKGGVTRADGCVTKGHTRGKMITMGS